MLRNILILLCIVFVIYYVNAKQNENFNGQHVVDPKYKGDTITVDMLDDPVFSDVIVYNNDPEPYLPNQEIGLEKCVYECDGKCVEFGVTGTAFCFLNKDNV